jgi:hypothetical protein
MPLILEHDAEISILKILILIVLIGMNWVEVLIGAKLV